MEEQKHIACNSRLAKYQSFIGHNLESHINQYCERINGRRIRACFHGWVILSDDYNSVKWSLWNPITSKFICLPPLINDNKTHYSYECCLSSPPEDDQGSVFLLFPQHMPSFVFCRLDRKRKRLKWTKMSYDRKLRNITGLEFCRLECPTCFNGKVYALAFDEGNCMLVIQVNIMVRGKEVVISLLPFVELPDTSEFRFHIVSFYLKGSYKELFYIKLRCKENYKKKIDELRLFKLNMTSVMWEEMGDLKDAIFFIQFAANRSSSDSYSVFYKPAVTSEIGGCVYNSNEMGEVIAFHVKDRTMSVPLVPCIVQESQVVVWAMLECGIEADHHKLKQEEQQYKDKELIVVPNNAEFDNTTSESRLLNIPFHMLEMILEYCVGVEYMKFRSTCSRCRYAATSIQWNNKTTLRRWQMHSLASPWLMVLDNRRAGIITFIDPIHGDKYFIKTPQELHDGYKIYCSKYGWLLLCNENVSLVFFNPVTGAIRKFPSCGYYFKSLCFSAPPTSPDCMVAGVTRRHVDGVHICIYFVSQDATWNVYRLNDVDYDPFYFNFLTFRGRDMYFLCDNKRLEFFKGLCDGEWSRVVVVDEVPRSCCVYPTEYFLSICDQHLVLVIIGEVGESVEVFKLNTSTKDWEKLDDLGKHMIYISETSCIYLEAKSSEMENKIYFPRVLDYDDTKIVFYSLETCMYHTFDDKNVLESSGVDILKVNQHYGPHIWIEPSWS